MNLLGKIQRRIYDWLNSFTEQSGFDERHKLTKRHCRHPRVKVTIGQLQPSFLGLKAMLDFDLRVALGDRTLTSSEMTALMASNPRLREVMAQWDKIVFCNGAIPIQEAVRLVSTPTDDMTEVQAGYWLATVLDNLRNPERIDCPPLNGELKATLRPYQDLGARWLWQHASLGLGACLADDMGLGKTLQVLALLLMQAKRPGPPSLVVVPTSLLGNWKAEIVRFAPSLRAMYVHPSEASRYTLDEMAAHPVDALACCDVVVTSHGMLSRQPWLMEASWRLVVVDEAQAILNPKSSLAKTIKRIKAESRIAMTGTPVMNRLADVWSLFSFLCPGLMGSRQRFRQTLRAEGGMETLRRLTQPYILRRLKTDKRIIADLPDKIEVREFCTLQPLQAAVYSKLVKRLAEEIRTATGIRRQGLVLNFLMRFKQVCNHPAQITDGTEYPIAESGKFLALKALATKIALRGEKAIVFTQFRKIADSLASLLKGVFGRDGLVLHGGTEVRERKRMVDAFQRQDGPPWMILSLKAGGTGLNLTAATHVIHFDRWWNSATENQATDRAFRIGQTQNVMVHKMISRGTVEEKIDALIESKRRLTEDFLEERAGAVVTELSDEELIRLVRLDVKQAQRAERAYA